MKAIVARADAYALLLSRQQKTSAAKELLSRKARPKPSAQQPGPAAQPLLYAS